MVQLFGSILTITLIVFLHCHLSVNGADDECEVCVKFLTRFQERLEADNVDNEPEIQRRLRADCNSAKGKENRFCYYIGGTDDAATGLVQEVTKPCSFHVPATKICAKLKKKDSQICELKYDKKIDWKTVNFNKMRVKQLKKILLDWGEECKGCLEKQDFIKRIKELLPKYVSKDEL